MRRNKKFWIRLTSLLVILFFSVLLIYFDNKTSKEPFIQVDFGNLFAPRAKTLAGTEMRIPIEAENNVSFAVLGKSILKCTRDGLKCYSSNGDELWNETFTTTFPIIQEEQDVVIVSEKNGRSAYIFNNDGLMYRADTEFPIISYKINELGYSAIMSKLDIGYLIEIYDSNGTSLISREEGMEGVFPTAFDISDDGRVVAVNYLNINKFAMESQILFYYINSEGKNYADNMYASSVIVTEHVSPIIQFMQNNRLIAVYDNQIVCMDERPNELWAKPIDCVINNISFDSKKYVWIAFGEALTEAGSEYKNKLVCWDLTGKELVKMDTGQVTYLHTESNTAIVGEVRNFYSVNTAGDKLWFNEFTQDVFQLIPIGSNTLFVGKDEAEILKTVAENEKRE